MKPRYLIAVLLLTGILAVSSCSFLGLSSEPKPTPEPTGPPKADFVADQTSLGGKGWVTFTSTSTGNIKYWNWGLGDGTTAIGPIAKTYYHENGYYTVTLTVSGPEGKDTMTKTEYILVYGCG